MLNMNQDEIDWGSLSKREFKRLEMEHELGHEVDNISYKKSTFAPIVKEEDWSTKEALAVACSIFRQKGYTSTSVHLADDPTGDQRWHNKEMLMYELMPRLANSKYLLNFVATEQDYEQAEVIIKYFRRLSFGVIGDSLNDYLSKMFSVTQKDRVSIQDLGVLASAPMLYDKEITQKEVAEQIKDTEKTYIGKEGESVTVNIRYIKIKFLPNINCFAHTAVTDTNHLITFLNKIELGKPGTTQKIKARVKKHGVDYHTKHPETQLNYVKVVDNILVWQ